MTTAVVEPPRTFAPPSPPEPVDIEPPVAPGSQRVVLRGISWGQYDAVGEAFRDRGGMRITFDRGAMEILTTSHRHEIFKKLKGVSRLP